METKEFIQCLAHAGDKFREITGEVRPRPSTGNYPGEYWRNAAHCSEDVVAPGVAIWVNNEYTDEGHALCVGAYTPASNKYHCYEANWDNNGRTREFDKTAHEIKAMYPSKVWRGCVY